MAKPPKAAAKAAPAPTLVRIQWDDSTVLPLQAADQLHIRASEDQFYLTFGQVNLPVFDGDPPDGFVAHIRPLSRFVVSAIEMEKMVRAMTDIAARWRERTRGAAK